MARSKEQLRAIHAKKPTGLKLDLLSKKFIDKEGDTFTGREIQKDVGDSIEDVIGKNKVKDTRLQGAGSNLGFIFAKVEFSNLTDSDRSKLRKAGIKTQLKKELSPKGNKIAHVDVNTEKARKFFNAEKLPSPFDK